MSSFWEDACIRASSKPLNTLLNTLYAISAVTVTCAAASLLLLLLLLPLLLPPPNLPTISCNF
jgi:hypothetical protein